MLQPVDKTLEAWTASRVDSQFDALARSVRSKLLLRRILRLTLQALIFLSLVSILFFRTPQVEGRSMLPHIEDGDHVLINTLAYDFDHPIARGEIIAFARGQGDDQKIFLKRVVALPGERIEIDNGRVAINGAPLQEPYTPLLDRTNLSALVVPSGAVFVLGDNRAESDDSRSFGPVPRASIIGKALLIIWPLGRVQKIH